MAFCNKCGAQIDDNAAVCPACGAQQNAANNANPNPIPNPIPANMQGADYSGQYDPNDVQQNKVMAVLAYIGLLFLIPLLAAPQSPYARFHTNQGLILFIVDIIVGVVGGILSVILAFIPIAGPIISGIITFLLSACTLALMILGIVNAATGKAKELPVIGKFRLIK